MSLYQKLPRDILEQAIKLRDAQKQIYIALYCLDKPVDAQSVAEMLGFARAYVSMRLNQLVEMGLAKRSKKGKKRFFEVVRK